MTDYYKDLWTKPNQHGTIFWRDVNFDTPSYKLQELRFRNMLQSLKRLNKEYVPPREIHSVLEVGVGSGRMLRIVTEELHPPIYEGVDIRMDENIKYMLNNWYQVDITSNDFDEIIRGNQYDLVLASEIFMHIKPEDIERVVKLVTRLLAPNGIIINIDLNYHTPDNNISEWCFVHDYDKLYTDNNLTPIFTSDMSEIQQKLFCYGK